MKIDDIIRKCIEIPGVSIKRSEFNAELLMKTKEGKGSIEKPHSESNTANLLKCVKR
mgnify:CR=1 FL=1